MEVQSEDPTTLVLSWQPPAPENQNGIIVHYVVNITEMETGRLLSFTAVNTTTLSVSTLHPFYTYTCIVAAVTIGIGPYSATVEVELPEDGKQVHSVCFKTRSISYLKCFFSHSTIQFSCNADVQHHYRFKLLSDVAESSTWGSEWNNSSLLH